MAQWMQVDLDLPDKPETQMIVLATGLPIDVVVGRLVMFWRLVERECYRRNAGVLPKYTTAILGNLCGGDAAFWEEVCVAGWLAKTADGLEVPGWSERFSPEAKKRAQAAMRKARYDARKRAGDEDESNADALPERYQASGGRDPKTKPKTEPKPEDLDATGRDDHKFSWTQETREAVREFCTRKFTTGPAAVFPKRLRDDDREFLLKLGFLHLEGKLPESIIDGGLEAIRHHEKPVDFPGAFLTSVLQDSCKQRGIPLNKLLAQTKIPEDLLRRKDQ